jgi:SAM-dependent methyltransferase
MIDFNEQARDRWMRDAARSVSAHSRVLDVGAGSAPYRSLFSHCDYRTTDFTALRPEQLRNGAYTQVDYVCDATQIPVDSGSFDVVVCTEVLEHVPEPIRVVHELARVLRPGGRLLLSAPLGSGLHQTPYHFYGGYTPYWYERFLRDAGFDDISVQPNGGFFALHAQESRRFAYLTRPWGSGVPRGWRRLAWAPLWLLLAPVLLYLVPSVARRIDRALPNVEFTIGYHVTATKRAADAAA